MPAMAAKPICAEHAVAVYRAVNRLAAEKGAA